ncbi:hypothetical protein FBU59_003215 [Linderina macrospora]|uniref:Uncharacterized protein n=1 Tax=Linderina macrospora TaxID=4868 RepID=A0ACC1J9A0_9FUNG|nr:hypothetical protein FBU59_003215 [Linderina macrospora]
MITFEDLVQPKKLRKAILSAFLVDMDWLKSEIQGHTKIVLVENYNPKAQPRGIMQYDQGMWTIVHPEFHPRQAYPVMHSKLMLLFYDEHVRLVISSANLIPVDWSMIQNILFIQDLPYTAGRPQPSTVFGDSLASALLDLSVPWQAVMPLENIDFSNVTVHLITSVPTSYPRSTDHSKFYGISRLAQIALSMRKRKTDADNTDLNLYVYGTSMSAINEEYLSVFYRCAQGVDPQAMYSTYKWRINKSMVRVYIGFYTESQAREFKHEEAGRGCMMFYRKVFASYSFPKDRMYKITTPLPRVVTHAKVIMARMGRTQSHGWVYLGSHNFTQGAWGRPKGTLRPNINNYELGVIIPDVKYVVEAGTARAMWNGKVVPLSFEVEWQKYSSEDIPCLRG